MATPPGSGTPPARTPLEQSVYDGLRNAEFASRYWPIIARRYKNIDMGVSIAVTFLSCGAVGTWFFVRENPKLYGTISVLAALASIAQALLGWASQVEAIFRVSAGWAEYKVAYLQLWSNLTLMSPQDAQKKFEEIQRNEASLTAECQRFPQGGKKLKGDIQNDVQRIYP